MIVADTGAVIALIDADDQHHETLRSVFEAEPDLWVLPWAILPEVDYLVSSRLASRIEVADASETSCSTERPPNRRPTRSFAMVPP